VRPARGPDAGEVGQVTGPIRTARVARGAAVPGPSPWPERVLYHSPEDLLTRSTVDVRPIG